MFNLYSRRKRDAEGNPEIFIYDEFPTPFRNQFFTIIQNVFEQASKENRSFARAPEELCKMFAQEKGLKYIPGNFSILANSFEALEIYVDCCSDENFLDLMDFIFGVFVSNDKIHKQCYIFNRENNFFQDAIDELNLRLKQHSLGYEFLNREIIVKTNTVVHENIVKPTLKLLLDEEFRGAEEEYLLAFEHYRKSENKDAILNAMKAFESTMKTICSGLGYVFDKDKANAKQLIAVLEKNSFYPSYLNNHITNIRTTLESGAPTLRNKTSGHGQGTTVQNITDAYVEYALNLVATNIVFLYRIYKEKKLQETII